MNCKSLVNESRNQKDEAARIDQLADKFEDLKATLLSTVGAEGRRVARAVVRFRQLIEFLRCLPNAGTPMRDAVVQGSLHWKELLFETSGITSIEPLKDEGLRWASLLQRGLMDSYICQFSVDKIRSFESQWGDLTSLDQGSREVVFDELAETVQPSRLGIVVPEALVRHPRRLPNSSLNLIHETELQVSKVEEGPGLATQRDDEEV